MIVHQHTAMRGAFAPAASQVLSATFIAGPTQRITRAAGSFVTDGYEPAMSLDVVGSASNDGRRTLATVDPTVMTVTGGAPIVSEGPVSALVKGVFRDPDGFERWPVALMRAGGFSGGFTGLAGATAFPRTVSVDGAANGAEAYDAYLSQRTDAPARRLFSIVRTAGKSGTWTLSLASLAVSDLALSGPTATLTDDQLSRLLRYVALYVRRHADGAIQWVDLHKAVLPGLV